MITKLLALLITAIILSLPAGSQAQNVTSISVEPVNPHINVGDFIQFRAIGAMDDGTTRVLSPLSSTIAASEWSHTCAVLPGGTVKCWGYNYNGELGAGTPPNEAPWAAYSPVSVSGISNAITVATGQQHSCAVLSDGTVECWGANVYGQLGNGGTATAYTPVPVSLINNAIAVAGGKLHNCALLSDGMVACWGYNYAGQLGMDRAGPDKCYYDLYSCSSTPVDVAGVANAIAIAAGDEHSCALLSDATVKCWGWNYYGQSGNGDGIQYHISPVAVSGIDNAVAIDAEGHHTCALLADGTVRCWGYNAYGELGDGTRNTAFTPVAVNGIDTATAIDSGRDFSCALLADGSVKCWGKGEYGSLGNGANNDSLVPVTVSGINDARSITAGALHACSLLSGGIVKCWGYNTYGALGDGTGIQSNVPVAVSLLIMDTAGSIVWSSSNVPVATINSIGLATGIDDGVSAITATLGDLSGSTTLTVGTVFNLSITKEGAGSGTVVSLDGWINCGPDCGETYGQGAVVTLQADAANDSLFAGWSGDPDCADGTVTMDANKTCTATFSLDVHTITVTKNGTGTGTVLIGGPGGPIVCGGDCQETYPSGTGILLDTIPFDDSEFAGWSGDPDCEDGNVLMDADKTCNATFNLQSHRLIIGKPGNGSGTVTSVNVAGINCGNDCSELYPVGTIVTLQATPDQWNNFAWGGDPDCADGEVTMGDTDVTCFAVFSVQTYTLTLTKDGSGSGVVAADPGGVNCGLNCPSADAVYNGGTEVTLTAGTNLPWIFMGWGGDPDCSDGIVTMDANRNCTVTFVSLEDLQFQQMQLLRIESRKTPEFRIENGIPRFISMRVPIPAALPDDPVIQALDFLDRYKYLYRINEPYKDIYLKRIKTNRFDEIGGGTPDPSNIEQHLFFGQQKDGIPVYGANLSVHMRGSEITSTNGNYLTNLPDFKLPAVQSPAAEAIALADVHGSSKKITGKTKLFYYNRGLTAIGGGTPDPADTPTKLAWRVMVRGLRNSDGAGTSWRLFIDAQDGSVLSKIDNLQTHGANKDFDIETANNTTSNTCWNGLNTDDDEWFDQDGETGYPGADDDNYLDGQNAYDFAHQTYNFYFDNFHHHSWNNGQGGVCGIFGCPDEAQVEVMVHVGNNWDNASYSPDCDHLKFGEGYASDDVFTHEYTHAVTRWSAELEYENQSGALNESYSDVMAAMLDDDWFEGEGKPINGEDGDRGGTIGGSTDIDGNPVGDGIREKGSECDNGVANDGGGNGVDDDDDGVIDEGCLETDIDCGNGQDDDGDGFNDEGCPETGNNCGDGDDDDNDGYIDEGCPGSCLDGIDNGLTGEFDVADTDCVLRDLSDPARKGDPDHIYANMSGDGYGIRVLEPGTDVNCDQDDPNYNDCGWVHTNSSIPNKAAYLLTMGGVHPGSGIAVRGLGGPGGDGREKARRLYYDVLTTRMFPNAFLIDARDETVELAAIYAENDDYGFLNLDVCSVMNAFAAVGLGASDVDCDGTADYRDGDNDGDAIRDNDDNCPYVPNIQQDDMDGDDIGDRCDTDTDGDGIENRWDNCPTVDNADQDDADIDGTGDACEDDDLDGVFNPVDTCPGVSNTGNDMDGDGIDNACDTDNDNDGIENELDNCPSDYNPLQRNNDDDEYGDSCDNCDTADNPDQYDMNNDGQGDACDDDIDGDGTPNADDPCPIDPLPVLILRGNEILSCQSNEDLAQLFSGNFGDFVEGMFNFPSLTDSIKLPVFPCIDDGCPDWLDENYMTEVSLSLPAGMEARIVDDKGFVISKGRAGIVMTVRFRPAADSFFRFAGNLPSPTGVVRTLSEVGVQPVAFKGQNYFIEIYPSADVVPGQQYPFTIRVRSGADIDGDGYPATVDCNDNNPAINPGAVEIANDGIDEDCNPATPVSTVSGIGLNQPLPGFNASLHVNVNGTNPGAGMVKYRYSRERLTLTSTAISSISVSGGTATVTGTGNAVRTGGASCTGCPYTVTIVEGSPDRMSISINNGAYFKDPASGARALTSGNFNQTGQ
ncbi:MAG: hypothetical protein C4526_04935 [Nitrospiraceae bacterium]|nr:MAG: hypothetical protein C4526_04935 [Nitrospiraceae bacterium]